MKDKHLLEVVGGNPLQSRPRLCLLEEVCQDVDRKENIDCVFNIDESAALAYQIIIPYLVSVWEHQSIKS